MHGQREPFWHPQNAPKSFSAGVLPWTLLWQLTTLPQTPSRLGMGIPLPIPYPLGASILRPHFSTSSPDCNCKHVLKSPALNNWTVLWNMFLLETYLMCCFERYNAFLITICNYKLNYVLESHKRYSFNSNLFSCTNTSHALDRYRLYRFMLVF